MYLRNAMQMYGNKHVKKDFINKTRPVSYLTRGKKAIFFFFQVLRYYDVRISTLGAFKPRTLTRCHSDS